MVEKIIDILKRGDIKIPGLLFYRYKDLNLDLEDLYIITYLINQKDLNYNPKKMALDLNLNMVEVMEKVDSLVVKGFIKINVVTVGKMHHEYIDLEELHQKLAFLVVNDNKKNETKDSFVADIFEKEFNRQLSPIEYELIDAWQDNVYSKELIVAALKEAVYNGVTNIRYIDRILNDWHKKGIKTLEDIKKEKENLKKQKIESEDIFEYDWLNDKEQ